MCINVLLICFPDKVFYQNTQQLKKTQKSDFENNF